MIFSLLNKSLSDFKSREKETHKYPLNLLTQSDALSVDIHTVPPEHSTVFALLCMYCLFLLMLA